MLCSDQRVYAMKSQILLLQNSRVLPWVRIKAELGTNSASNVTFVNRAVGVRRHDVPMQERGDLPRIVTARRCPRPSRGTYVAILEGVRELVFYLRHCRDLYLLPNSKAVFSVWKRCCFSVLVASCLQSAPWRRTGALTSGEDQTPSESLQRP